MQNLSIIPANTQAAVASYQPQSSVALSGDTMKLMENKKSENTRKAYKKFFTYFADWAMTVGVAIIDSETDTVNIDLIDTNLIRNYIAHIGTQKKSVAFARSSVAAIGDFYCDAIDAFDATVKDSMIIPTQTKLVSDTLKAYERTYGKAPKKAKAAKADTITAVTHDINFFGRTAATQLRNKALLLLGFAGAFRRSELAELKVSDFEQLDKNRAIVHIRKSKTDQANKGATKPIMAATDKNNCPIKAVKNWIAFAGLGGDDFLFCSIHKSGEPQTQKKLDGKDVNRIIKAVYGDSFSGHSLRSGFISEAFERGLDAGKIQRVTLHKLEATVASYRQIDDSFAGAFAL